MAWLHQINNKVLTKSVPYIRAIVAANAIIQLNYVTVLITDNFKGYHVTNIVGRLISYMPCRARDYAGNPKSYFLSLRSLNLIRRIV